MILRLEKARTDNWTGRKFFSGTAAKIGPSLDITGFPVTGLAEKDEKDFEKKLDLPKGTLGKSSKFWNTFMVVVDADGTLLNSEIPENALKIKFLSAQSLVALGMDDIKNKPKAEYILYSEEQEKKSRNKSRRARQEANKVAYAMSIDELKGLVSMYGHNPNNMADDAIEDFVFAKLEESPPIFMGFANDPDKETKIFVLSLVNKGIIEVRGGAYHYEGEAIAYGLESTALFLKQKVNQELRIALEKRLDTV